MFYINLLWSKNRCLYKIYDILEKFRQEGVKRPDIRALYET